MKNLLITAALLLAVAGLAQGQPGATGPNPTPPATAVPLDGGASLLLAAGVAGGLRRLRQRRRQSAPGQA